MTHLDPFGLHIILIKPIRRVEMCIVVWSNNSKKLLHYDNQNKACFE